MQKEPSLIFLTGFSGSGKSTIGPLLANSLGYEFVDLDALIERECGKSINQIFAEAGEAAFRQHEEQTLETLLMRRKTVVSLGGGVLEQPRAFELVRQAGTVVYLKSPVKTLARRLSNKTDRPLLKGEQGEKLSQEEIEQKIAELLARREPRYECADITVETDAKRIGSTVEELTRKIERYMRTLALSSEE
uniref:Shikimate kinase n=1 Tax=Chlorobium chlorochromatii (strain CaD3) TaxID=340177 RepID=AROK_CHLCH|nr:RecName: Full=Shikimate kinase; Short=SK [Chlorobium chlorochromatii CaD3]